MDNRIKRAIDASFSYMDVTGAHRDIIMRKAKGETVVKKKLSASLAFVIIAVLVLAGVALAASGIWENRALEIKAAEEERGSYIDWTIADKINLVQALVEEGVIEPTSEAASLLHNALDEADAHSLADKLLTDLTGQKLANVDVYSITRSIWGDMSNWTEEQQIWWQRNITYPEGEYPSDAFIQVPVGEDSISKDEAVRIAKEKITRAFDLVADYFDTDTEVFAVYYVSIQDTSWERWLVGFNNYSDKEASYSVCVDGKTGEVVEDKWRGVQTPEKQRATQELEFTPELDDFIRAIQAMYKKVEEEVGGLTYAFGAWPLEYKAEYSKTVNSLARLAKGSMTDIEFDSYLMGYGGAIQLAKSAFEYGIPDEKSITQEKAKAMADAALLDKYPISADALSLYDYIWVYYDVTDPCAPLWKFLYVGTLDGNMREALGKEQERLEYKIELNAYSGEVVKAVVIERGWGMIGDIEHEKQFY
jgi:hypothetical protein